MNKEQLIKLYREINDIGFTCMYRRKNDYVFRIKEILPEIIDFANWFLKDNIFDIETELYMGLCENLNSILSDSEQAFVNNDYCLMMDAMEEGIQEYIKMFVDEKDLIAGEA